MCETGVGVIFIKISVIKYLAFEKMTPTPGILYV